MNIKTILVCLIMLRSQFAYAGEKIPAAKLPLLSGKSAPSLNQVLKDHDLSIVQIWASWCTGCGAVMADIALRTKTDTNIGYASLSIDEDMESAQEYFRAKPAGVKAAFPNTFLDAGGSKVAKPLNIKSLPILLLVDRSGKIVETLQGHPKPEELTTAILRHRTLTSGK